MTRRPFAALAVVLTLALVAPSAFFAAAPRAHADLLGIVPQPVIKIADTSPSGIGTWVESTFSAIKEAITAVSTVTTAAASAADFVDKWVLEPMAFIESGNLIKSITAGVLDFVTGKTNGTGHPQFVTNLRGQILSVSDQQAIAFFSSFSRNSNSPFAAAITSSLRSNYAQQTSLAGFFAQNQCTLSQVSPNINSFLAGNWSQGGTAAWFALTTQSQNNPYVLHQRAQEELATLVAGATSDQLNQLAWGQGFLSWCGPQDTTPGAEAQSNLVVPATPNVQPPTLTLQSDGSYASACPSGTQDTASGCVGASSCPSGYTLDSGGSTCSPTAGTVSSTAGADCTHADGTPGTIETPGSTIKAGLDKALGLNADKVVAFGNQVGPQINAILGQIGTVMNTINFATDVLGGGGSGGLAGVGATPSGGGQSALSAYANSTGYLGSSVQDAQQNGNAGVQSYTASANAAANSAVAAHDTAVASSGSSGSGTGSPIADFSLRVDQYESAWNTVSGAANTASSSTLSLASSCAAQASAAQTALTNEVAPVLIQDAQASTTIAAARRMIAKVQNDLASNASAGAGGAYAADLQTLQAMPPTTNDLSQALIAAQVTGGATANPSGSLTVTGGTTVDQMQLIAANATALNNACAP